MDNSNCQQNHQHTTFNMIEDEERISRILGHTDTMDSIDSQSNHSWTTPVYNNLVEPYSNVETLHEYFSSIPRCYDEESRFQDEKYPQKRLEKNCSFSESCQSICPKDSSKCNLMSRISSSFKKSSSAYRHWCLLAVSIAFGLGLILGIIIPLAYLAKDAIKQDTVLYKDYNKSSASYDFITGFTIDDVKEVVNDRNASERVFLPAKAKLEYAKSKLFFPTIHDLKKRGKNALEKPKKSTAHEINRPKLFSSVSFVDDVVKNLENLNYESISDDLDSKTTILKYLDMGDNNKTGNFFVEFGKKILENSLNGNNKMQNITDSKNDENTLLHDNIYWGAKVERSLPKGYGPSNNEDWMNYMKKTSAIKMESGCGRMQNRLVTFEDGRQACVRYRQNTDQIQGELFSFYLAQILQLPNLAPSLISIVNLTDPLWKNIANDIGSAQWNSNRPVVMTKYIANLESAHIPDVFKPKERHLNKFDILNIIKKGTDQNDITSKKNGDLLIKKLTETLFINEDIKNNKVEEEKALLDIIVDELPEKQKDAVLEHVKAKIGDDLLNHFIELAQWSDLIIFDYLTANLDRIVNNLYNFQWNVNIMDAPAHNLARKVDSNLLLFLDNESGLLHGYRLLHKYEVYHTLLLDNLCVFRRSTADVIMKLHRSGEVGDILNGMFRENNDSGVLDVLPPLPEKSVKILNERIGRVVSQIRRCEDQFGR